MSAAATASGSDALSKLPSTWAEMHLSAAVSEAIRLQGWEKPTTVQRACVGPIRDARDVAIQSRTGSGKTGAFVVPLIERLVALRSVGACEAGTLFAVILVPSAELADQTVAVITTIAKYVRPRIVVHNASAGDTTAAAAPSSRLQAGVDIVVVTAAGLATGIRHGHVTRESLSTVHMLVIDEADLLVASMAMRTIRGALPPSHQTVLISATLNEGVASLKGLLHDPVTVTLTEASVVEEVKEPSASADEDKDPDDQDGSPAAAQKSSSGQVVAAVDDEPIVEQVQRSVCMKDPSAATIEHRYLVATEDCHKHTLLYALLRLKHLEGRTLVFVDDEDDTFRLLHFLEQMGISAVVYDASMPVRTRLNTLKRFERGECLVMICTDSTLEAAEGIHDSGPSGVHRGIDFFKVRNVILFDGIRAPTALALANYTHRAGRTGRGKDKGTVVTFFSIPQAERGIRQFREYLKGRGDACKLFHKLHRPDAAKLQYRVDTALANVTRNAAKKLRVATVASEMARNEVLRSQLGDGDTAALTELVNRSRKRLRSDRQLVEVPQYMKLKAEDRKTYETRVAGRDPLRRERVFNKVVRVGSKIDPLRDAARRIRKNASKAKKEAKASSVTASPATGSVVKAKSRHVAGKKNAKPTQQKGKPTSAPPAKKQGGGAPTAKPAATSTA